MRPIQTKSVDYERAFLSLKRKSANEIELLAEVEGKVAGLAGISSMGSRDKVKHRAVFGISIDKTYWGLGIGRAMTESCIDIARQAGYGQLELEVVTDNDRALRLYESCGFTVYGRNPKGFRSRYSGWQELLSMRLEL